MNEADEADRLQRFEQSWRAAAERPAGLTAGEGVRRALEIARSRRRRRATGWTLAAAASLAALALTLGRAPAAVAPGVPPPSPTAASDGPEVVVMWLDAETPLYMTLAPDPGRAGGGR
jgi:hypothetical protein